MKKFYFLTFLLMLIFFASCEQEGPNISDSQSKTFEGLLPGKFSISKDKQISFSCGNLQYRASTDTWRFAENQWDCVGESNANISKNNYNGWIDLFGFGTASSPMSCKADNAYYGSGYKDLSEEEYIESDWGWHNKISNGGNKVHCWRTLSRDEFVYLMQSRPHAEEWTFARVNGVLGIIIVPDDWVTPENVEYIARSSNIFSQSEWTLLENAGAVFLPAAGLRDIDSDRKTVTIVDGVGKMGFYWTATRAICFNGFQWRAIPFIFDAQVWTIPKLSTDLHSFMYGYSVRLVQDVK